jgi:LysM repeat protein
VAVSSIAGVFGGGASPSPSPSTPGSSASSLAGPTPSLTSTGSSAPSLSPTTPASVAATPISYVVQSGDTLGLIAARFGTTVDEIMVTNGLTSDVITPGQELTIP